VPYFAVAAVDLAIVLGVGIAVFGVPFRGSALVFGLGALLFLFVTLGIGVLISTVSQNQGQAIQLAVMIMLPQILLSGLIFPLASIAVGVRWLSYVLPLTYFNEISRGVMLRAEPLAPLWQPFVFLALLGAVVVTLAILRFRSYLAPAPADGGRRRGLPARHGRGTAAVPAARTQSAQGQAAAPVGSPTTGQGQSA
jgi:ABC-2 type transport system permease protein